MLLGLRLHTRQEMALMCRLKVPGLKGVGESHMIGITVDDAALRRKYVKQGLPLS